MGVLGKLKYVAAAGGGAILGYAGGLYSETVARANVAVRPELAKVDWFTALFADHLSDWIFYHYPTEATTGCAVAGALVATAAAYFLIRD